MTKVEKALAACKEYDRLMTEIRKNTKTIGDGLANCTRMAPVPSAPFLKELPDGVKSHVQEVFAGYVGGDWEPEHRHYTEVDFDGIGTALKRMEGRDVFGKIILRVS